MPRILSCFTNCYGPSGVWAAARQIRQAGIDHLELALRGHDFGGLVIPESAVITERADDLTAGSFVDELARQGVKVSGCNVGGADLRTEAGVTLTERRIRFAARWFGVKICVSGAGQPANEPERARVVAALRRLGDVAGELGITLALETHKGPTQNAAAMLALMADVDHPKVRLNFDTGNISYYNAGLDPCTELEKVKHLVRNVHLKDSRGGFVDWYFPALGDGGAVDFTRVREILDGVGFDGPYTIEIEGIGGEPEPGLEARQERITRSVNHLLRHGYSSSQAAAAPLREITGRGSPGPSPP
jgi:inosose dehydratase